MKVGILFYGLATAATGMLDIVWGQFDASHQPIKSLGQHIRGEHMLAYIVGLWLVAAGIALLWRRTAKIGAVGSAIIYLAFALLWIPRLFDLIHSFSLGMGVIVFGLGGVASQVLFVSPALFVYAETVKAESARQERAEMAARWMLGLPPAAFGLGHLINLHAYARFVPHWVPFKLFWIVVTGVAFLLAGCAIVTGIRDVLAARLLALMLLVFEAVVEAPPVFVNPHSQEAWGGAVYNFAAIGACLLFTALVESSRTNPQTPNLSASYADACPSESLFAGS